jgi:hypothetical protein
MGRRRWLLVCVGVAASALSVHASPGLSPVALDAPPPPGAQVVTVGVYVNRIHGIDLAASTYFLDAYVWLRWTGELDPAGKLELVNGIDRWGMTVAPDYDEPKVDATGARHQVLHVEGRFQHPFDLSRFPLDAQDVDLVLESSLHAVEQLVLVPDVAGSGVSPSVRLPGWRIRGSGWDAYRHTYPTSFGDPEVKAPQTTFSTLRFRVSLARPITFFLWKLLLPLAVVLVSAIGAMLLHPRYRDARIAMPLTALLTAVFLQQSFNDLLPEIGYMVLMDRVYVLSYLLIIGALAETIATANLTRDDDEAAHARARRIDRIFIVAQLGAFVAGVILLVVV